MKLVLVNGPPGVGKSALARRYVGDHSLALHLGIDAIRCSLGCWEKVEESKLIARSLAVAMADAHLRAGHDVIVPQYLGRVEFIEELERLAHRVGADFFEFLLWDTAGAVLERFRARRVELAARHAHPQADVNERSLSATIAEAFERPGGVERERSRTHAISSGSGRAEAYEQVLTVLA